MKKRLMLLIAVFFICKIGKAQTNEKFLKLTGVVHYDSTFTNNWGWPQFYTMTIAPGRLLKVQSLLVSGSTTIAINNIPFENSQLTSKNFWLRGGDVIKFSANGCSCPFQGYKITAFEYVIE